VAAHAPAQRVVIESPLRGEIERNVVYADACMLDSLLRGEAPFLGHLIYPRVLNDALEIDRARGIAAHVAWIHGAELLAVYTDYGVTDGMRAAIQLARSLQLPCTYRALGDGWRDRLLAQAHATNGFFH
jgi:hypothetical protein